MYVRTSLVTHNASRAHAYSTECDSQSSLSFHFIRSLSLSPTLTPCTHTHIQHTFSFSLIFGLLMLCYVARFPRIKSNGKQKNTEFGNHIVYLTNIFERLKNHIFQIVVHSNIYENRCSLTNFQQLYKIESILIATATAKMSRGIFESCSVISIEISWKFQ